jgi:hypothetical protein
MSRGWFKLTSSLVLAALIIVSFAPSSAGHHAVLRFNLEEMVATADRIFVGRCLEAQETTDFIAGGNLAITRYTFEVEQAIKGRLKRRLTFSQLGHRARRSSGKGGEITMHGRVVTPDSLHGMAEYGMGDRVVLFLIPNYLGGKVTYPVGADQGAFFISQLPSGDSLARNSVNNLGLFTAPYNGWRMREAQAKMIFPSREEPLLNLQEQGLSVRAEALVHKRGALPLNDFLTVVQQIVVAHGHQKGVITN